MVEKKRELAAAARRDTITLWLIVFGEIQKCGIFVNYCLVAKKIEDDNVIVVFLLCSELCGEGFVRGWVFIL